MISFDRLQKYKTKEGANVAGLIEKTSPGTSVIAGQFGALNFMVTLDHDGHCEASLAGIQSRPTEAQIAAFYKAWGVERPQSPPSRIFKSKGLHWVVAPGRPNQ